MRVQAEAETQSGGQDAATSRPEVVRPGLDRWLAYAAVVAGTLFVLWQLHPSLIFSNTTTAGGDTGAHFSVPWFYIHNILDHFRLTGWSASWYDGYPLYVFYFPFPGVITALFGLVVPYGVAFKLTTVVGSLALPAAVYYFARSLKLSYLLSGVSAIMAVAYLFDRSYTIDGGNIASTLAGEYSFSISLALAFFAMAVLLVSPGRFKRRVLAGILLTLSLLSHILPAAFAVAVLVLLALMRRERKTVYGVGVAVGLTVLLAALWELPLIATYSYSTSMGWSRITTFLASLAPPDLRVFIALAAVGFIASIAMRIEFGIVFGVGSVASAVAFVAFPLKAVYNGRMLPFYVMGIYMLAGLGLLTILELIPAVISSVRTLYDHLEPQRDGGFGFTDFMGWQDTDRSLAGVETPSEEGLAAIGSAVGRLRRRLRTRRRVSFVATSGLILVAVLIPLVKMPSWSPIRGATSFVPGWIKWNYSGYEAKVGFPAYRALMLQMKSVGSTYGCGRAMWEYNSNQNDFGTPMALMLLPYWTNNCIDSMEGLFFESSATTPYHFMNQSELSASPSDAMAGLPYAGVNVALGVKHLQLLGVRYYMAFTPSIVAAADKNPSLRQIATVPAVDPSSSIPVLTETWHIYLVSNSGLVQPLTQKPVVMRGLQPAQSSWLGPSLAFYQNPSEYPVERLMTGPGSYSRVAPYAKVSATTHEPSVSVSNLQVANSSVSFDVSKTGVPVLVKISYFPNWHASGAQGPYRATPNLMVVIPTSRHVVLSYGRTGADWIGILISALTVLGIVAAGILLRRRSRSMPGVPADTALPAQVETAFEPDTEGQAERS